jgi:predicted SAM-dependent methyltransferase
VAVPDHYIWFRTMELYGLFRKVKKYMKLNLGCGSKIIDGYVNVESCDYFNADKSCDLEKFPYPFKDDSVDEILMSHTLERLG